MRNIKKIITTKTTIEGAGVKLERVFGFSEVPHFDPFLLLDHFGSPNPKDYLKGFPWHPHRGIETVTYMLDGEVAHADSLGNKGTIKSGDIQWMTAGSGIIHQEMPKAYNGNMQGFQLWINLQKKNKMIPPQYRGISQKDIVIVNRSESTIKLIAGSLDGTKASLTDLNEDIEYFDVKLSGTFKHDTTKKTVLIYVIEGSIKILDQKLSDHHCVLLGGSGEISIESKNGRFLFIAGNPLNEPIAWGGPIVMNTQKELHQAFKELDEGTFIKHGKSVELHEEYYDA